MAQDERNVRPAGAPPPIHQGSASWPAEEAQKLIERTRDYDTARPIVFESGFGPSGLPHLGTMAEILRPSFVQHAMRELQPNRASRLIVFIDDMDGLRKVPENVPGRDKVAAHLGKPVSKIPDPFECGHKSFADHMIGLLGEFLAPVEVEYELIRSSDAYAGGMFDAGLRAILEHREKIIAIIAPTLREENRVGWSPILPLCPNCGRLVERSVTAYHHERASVTFTCERTAAASDGCGWTGEQSITGGLAKAQWKVDWALRWHVFAVDYELYGKDLTDSARLSGQIERVLGGHPPLGFPFEMFLDEEGRKVSKSVGRGVSVDQWTRYAPVEVLKFFLLINPRRARRLFLESIPQYVDEYLDAVREYDASGPEERLTHPLTLVLQSSSARRFASELTFSMMMNLVGALGSSEREFIWKYLVRYDARIAADPETEKMGRALAECTLNYYRDFIEPAKKPYVATPAERAQLETLAGFLRANPGAEAEAIEKSIYEIGRANYEKPGMIFPMLYRSILGQERGPRLGAFIRLATPARMVELIDAAIARAA
jgi:lysyl-tRNA synthetase class 1